MRLGLFGLACFQPCEAPSTLSSAAPNGDNLFAALHFHRRVEQAICQRFAREGAVVGLGDIDRAGGEALAEALSKDGAQVRYLIYAQQGQLLSALGFGAAAWKIADRDNWIGWDATTRTRNLNYIVNNNRFLIVPHCLVERHEQFGKDIRPTADTAVSAESQRVREQVFGTDHDRPIWTLLLQLYQLSKVFQVAAAVRSCSTGAGTRCRCGGVVSRITATQPE